MIVWIDGTYGIGKSTIASEIIARNELTDTVLKDSDQSWRDMISQNPWKICGKYPQQRHEHFIHWFRREIEDASHRHETVIVTMALTAEECKAGLYEYLLKRENSILHIILTADKKEILERIEKDEKRGDKALARNHLFDNMAFLEKNFEDAVWVNTDGKSVEGIVDEVIEIIRTHTIMETE